MDPDVVAPAIVRTICILIATNPLPVIFIKCKLVRGNPIMGGSMSSSSLSGIVLYEAMFLTAAGAYLMTAACVLSFFSPEATAPTAQCSEPQTVLA